MFTHSIQYLTSGDASPEGHIAKGPIVEGRIAVGTILGEVRHGHELFFFENFMHQSVPLCTLQFAVDF